MLLNMRMKNIEKVQNCVRSSVMNLMVRVNMKMMMMMMVVRLML